MTTNNKDCKAKIYYEYYQDYLPIEHQNFLLKLIKQKIILYSPKKKIWKKTFKKKEIKELN
mgnify:CR=1 FL=1